MNKSVILSSLLAVSMFGVMGMGGTPEEAPKPVVGIVQYAQVYEKSQIAKTATARLEQLQKDAMTILEAKQKEMSEAEKAGDVEKMQRMQVEIQQMVYSMQSAFEAEQQQVLQMLQAALHKVVGQYRSEQQMTAVLEAGSVISFDSAADITDEIVVRLDKEKVEFGPMPELLPAAPAADAEAKTEEAAAPAAESAAPAEKAENPAPEAAAK